jgi:hypothetical protein
LDNPSFGFIPGKDQIYFGQVAGIEKMSIFCGLIGLFL